MRMPVKKLIDTVFNHVKDSMSALEPTTANRWSPTREARSLRPPLSPEPLTHQPPDDWGTLEPMEFDIPEHIVYIGVHRPKLHAGVYSSVRFALCVGCFSTWTLAFDCMQFSTWHNPEISGLSTLSAGFSCFNMEALTTHVWLSQGTFPLQHTTPSECTVK